MKPFFDSETKLAMVRCHAEKWINTPFVPHGRICGAGADCVNICAAVYIESGFISEFNPPAYSMDGGKHNEESQLVRWIEDSRKFEKLKFEAELQSGDLLCFKTFAKSAHHVGLVLKAPEFIHCLYGHKAMVSSLKDRTFKRMFFAAYRPITEQQ